MNPPAPSDQAPFPALPGIAEAVDIVFTGLAPEPGRTVDPPR